MAATLLLLVSTLIHLATASLVNIALRKPASTSSIRSGYNASTAVDGNTDAGGFLSQYIIDTGSRYDLAWWKVDLQREVQDATVRIYFRTDYTLRRNGVKLYTSTSSFHNSNPTSQGQLCHTVTGDPSGSDIPDVYNVTCPGRWRYLLLYTDTDNDGYGVVLDFEEVEVLVCSDGTYGEDCINTCSSRNCVTMTATCERDGRCPDGCQSGWAGLDCTQDHPPCTDNNNYGLNCDKLCTDRKCKAPSTSSCDRLTGRCADGCEDGWRQEDCTQECEFGSYGSSCTLLCNNRLCLDGSSPCDHVTGQCVGGCQAGYKGLDCKQLCDDGSYGPGCSLSCTDRKCEEPSSECNHVTGQCQNGCKSGYKGIDCVTKCDYGSYGDRCNLSCTDRKCFVSSSECDHVTGQCEDGCQAGYQGTGCRQVCNQGVNYGVNCIKSCSDRQCIQPSSVCDTKTGQCSGGCQVGWRGVDCKSQCPAGTFGSDCTSCSTRHCQGESDCPADGTCPQGCQDGYTGQTCMKICMDGSYGPDCTEKCGQCDGVCDSVDGRCPAGCLAGYKGTRCDVDLAALQNTEPARFTVASLVGAVVGSVLVVVLIIVGILLFLVRQGRLQWVKNLEDKKPVSRDGTQMSNIAPQPFDVSEHANSSSHTYNNDYAVLDSGTKANNKDYDVIEQKHYQNI